MQILDFSKYKWVLKPGMGDRTFGSSTDIIKMFDDFPVDKVRIALSPSRAIIHPSYFNLLNMKLDICALGRRLEVDLIHCDMRRHLLLSSK